MFDWLVFFLLIIVCVPGIIALIPIVKKIYPLLIEKWPEGKKIPSEKQFIISAMTNTFLFVILATAFGTAIAHKVNLNTSVLEALAHNQNAWVLLKPELFPILITSVGGAIIFLFAYYFLARPRLDAQTVQAMEKLRMAGGIWTRIFYGGIVEEVLMRWGVMTFFVWIGSLIFGVLNNFVFWSAILISGILFALGHLPGYLKFGCKSSFIFFATVILLNLWAAIIFGWLFWQYGLVAAMIAHMLFHFIWYPFDVYFSWKSTDTVRK